MYSVDTNIFLDWWERRYPPDVFPCVQKAIEDLINQQKFFAPERVFEEINQMGSKELKDWAKKHRQIFLPHDTDLQNEAIQIQYTYPDFIDNTTPFDEADRWIIALAKIKKQWTVISHETSFRRKKKTRAQFIYTGCMPFNENSLY